LPWLIQSIRVLSGLHFFEFSDIFGCVRIKTNKKLQKLSSKLDFKVERALRAAFFLRKSHVAVIFGFFGFSRFVFLKFPAFVSNYQQQQP
jgi:hypothetical protein